jgi:hypothetical protein
MYNGVRFSDFVFVKYKPHDITTLPDTNLVVVSSINSHNIQFIDIVRKNLCNEIHITGQILYNTKTCHHGFLTSFLFF